MVSDITPEPGTPARTTEAEAEPAAAPVQTAGFAADEVSVAQVEHRVNLIRDLMGRVMKEGEHYGKVPGCGDKMVLLKPGAEKLRVVFGLSTSFKTRRTDLPDGHREYEVRCTLHHLGTGRVVGEGLGCCSTMESKYRWRKAERVCPHCGQAAIIKGKPEYGGGWLCWKKKDGCGATFEENDPAIISQQVGRMENPDLADTYNTVLKIAEKRAAVDATLNATGASDLFTQDLDDRQLDDDAGSTRQPFTSSPADVNQPSRKAQASPMRESTSSAESADLTRTTLLKALQARGLDGGQARTIYGWFNKQFNWSPDEAQKRQFMADIEAGRFDDGVIRPRQHAA